ncbi:hypothetical protein NL676_026837 [Syzygium grande]|nr:hypothetical protein NL676_026837 [Syzygium grande]
MLQGGLVFRQSFPVRSYEVGTDYRATMEALMSYLQETALNHCKSMGLLADGFGCTPEMCKRNLVWVIRRMQIVVDTCPLWNSVIEVDTWTFASGRNGLRREWFIRDPKTGKTMAKAVWETVMMNKETRRLSFFKEEIRREIEVHTVKCSPIVDMDDAKLRRLDAGTADYVRTGLAPRWNDLDVNNHVNNVKYINWILEGVPYSTLENYELHAVNLEYRRECRRDSMLQSLSTLVRDGPGHSEANGGIEFDHLLLLENGIEIARARTKWRPRIAEVSRTHLRCQEESARSRGQHQA